jgi:hypothetical protein
MDPFVPASSDASNSPLLRQAADISEISIVEYTINGQVAYQHRIRSILSTAQKQFDPPTI